MVTLQDPYSAALPRPSGKEQSWEGGGIENRHRLEGALDLLQVHSRLLDQPQIKNGSLSPSGRIGPPNYRGQMTAAYEEEERENPWCNPLDPTEGRIWLNFKSGLDVNKIHCQMDLNQRRSWAHPVGHCHPDVVVVVLPNYSRDEQDSFFNLFKKEKRDLQTVRYTDRD